MQGRSLLGEPKPLAVSEQAFQAAILPEDRDDLRRLPSGPGQVAGGDVAGFQLQERRQQLRSRAGTPHHPENRMVHGSPHPVFAGHGTWEQALGAGEADETYIGGKARNMHADKRAEKITGTGGKDKAAVMGILERGPKSVGSKVRVKVIDNAKKKTLQSEIQDHVLAGSAVFTDALKSYEGLDEFQHEVVDHAVEYVRGEVHTNGLENFWSLLKRGIHGTYVSVEPFHLFRYLDEQAFRYNNRKGLNDGERFDIAVRRIFGKRLTWNQLTGKTDPEWRLGQQEA